MFWRLHPTFVEVTGKKLVGDRGRGIFYNKNKINKSPALPTNAKVINKFLFLQQNILTFNECFFYNNALK